MKKNNNNSIENIRYTLYNGIPVGHIADILAYIENSFVKQLGNEAVSGEPYHFTYYFAITPTSDNIDVTAYTVTLDNEKTLEEYHLTVPCATTALAGLMSSADKTKLDSIVANPTTTTTDPEISSIQIGDTKYKISASSHGGVTIDTDQTITGQKTFTKAILANDCIITTKIATVDAGNKPIEINKVHDASCAYLTLYCYPYTWETSKGGTFEMGAAEWVRDEQAWHYSKLIGKGTGGLTWTIDDTSYDVLTNANIIDNLTSTSTTDALSANQGNVLNTAISTKANDSAVVHLTGAETISGIKTYSANPVISAITKKSGSTSYTLTLPTKTGTLATTSDLSSYLPLSGGNITGSLTVGSNTVLTQGTATIATTAISGWTITTLIAKKLTDNLYFIAFKIKYSSALSQLTEYQVASNFTFGGKKPAANIAFIGSGQSTKGLTGKLTTGGLLYIRTWESMDANQEINMSGMVYVS